MFAGLDRAGYSYSGFLTLQHTVDSYILQNANGGEPVGLQVSMGLFPTAAFRSDNFFELAGNLLGAPAMGTATPAGCRCHAPR